MVGMPHVTGEAHLGIVTGGAIQRRQMTGYTVPTDAADDMVVATALAVRPRQPDRRTSPGGRTKTRD